MVGGVERAEFLLSVPPPGPPGSIPEVKQGGNFTCIATNEVGTTVSSVEIIVQRKWCCAVIIIIEFSLSLSLSLSLPLSL